MDMANPVCLKNAGNKARKTRESGFKTQAPLDEGAAGLRKLRNTIDSIDIEILGLLSRRCGVAKEVAKEKTRLGIPTFDQAREDAVLSEAERGARKFGLHPARVRDIFKGIIELSKHLQEEYRSGKNS